MVVTESAVLDFAEEREEAEEYSFDEKEEEPSKRKEYEDTLRGILEGISKNVYFLRMFFRFKGKITIFLRKRKLRT